MHRSVVLKNTDLHGQWSVPQRSFLSECHGLGTRGVVFPHPVALTLFGPYQAHKYGNGHINDQTAFVPAMLCFTKAATV